MTVLLLADVNDGKLASDAVAKTVAAVKMLGEIHVLVLGQGSDAAAAEAAKLDGVAKVLLATDSAFSHGLAEPISSLIVTLAESYDHICGAATSFCKNVMPRVAALLDVMVISDVTAVVDAATFERPIYAGNAIQSVMSGDATKVFTVRTANFTAVGFAGAAEIQAVTGSVDTQMSAWVADRIAASERPELTSAKVVVSGGRGLGSKESFDIIEQLADKLGAAVGASRAAIDSGYAPNDWQVGQTGKVVAPQLYIAVGISGAIQHLAGMKDSKVIVAINKDEDAPIFQVADYGLVADLFAAVPELTAKL